MTHRPSRAARLLLLTTVAVAAAGCTGSPAPASPTSVTVSPAPAAPGAPTLLRTLPTRGTVSVQPGPFNDRFTLAGTALRDGAVDTLLTIHTDVSDILVLEITADFYDAAGQLLGSDRISHTPSHDEPAGAVPVESVPLHLTAAPGWAARTSSAVLSVPVLVNE